MPWFDALRLKTFWSYDSTELRLSAISSVQFSSSRAVNQSTDFITSFSSHHGV
jgi:hypothetical protein